MFDRVTAGLAISQAEADAAMVARHLLATHAARLNERELYQTRGFHWARNASRRRAAFAVLERAAWIRRPTEGAGRGRPSAEWDVSPYLRGG
jgi:hypothetical protein